MKFYRPGILLGLACLFLFSGCSLISRFHGASEWRTIAEGIETTEFQADREPLDGNGIIVVVRIDPSKVEIEAPSLLELNLEKRMYAKRWAEQGGYLAVIPAGRYEPGPEYEHTGYMKHRAFVNSGTIRKGYNSVAAFHPKDPTLPLFQLFDLDVTPFDSIKNSYETILQNERLIKHKRENRWAENKADSRKTAIAEDSNGNLLFIYTNSRFYNYDFNEILLSLPLKIVTAQYLDGGPPAQLFVEGHFYAGTRIPNVIAVKPK